MRATLLALCVLMAACTRTPPPTPEQTALAPPTPALTGSSWVMESNDPDMAPTIIFNPGDRASGFTGCNQWFASFELESNQLRFNAVGSTRRACQEPVMATERAFIDALEATRTVQREGEILRLLNEENETVATFQQRRA